jgi:hypothetical protein
MNNLTLLEMIEDTKGNLRIKEAEAKTKSLAILSLSENNEIDIHLNGRLIDMAILLKNAQKSIENNLDSVIKTTKKYCPEEYPKLLKALGMEEENVDIQQE